MESSYTYATMRLNTVTTNGSRLLIKLSYLYCLWVVLIAFISFFSQNSFIANAEFYSSVVSLRKLDNIEVKILQNFRLHLKQQQDTVDITKRFIKYIKSHHKLASKNMSDYIGNPINAFTLIKRIVNDWENLTKFLNFTEMQNDLKQSLTQLLKDFQSPDENELKGSIRGLERLQKIYNLTADEMIKGNKYGDSVNWRDCFEIGVNLLENKSYVLSTNWLELALRKLKKNENESQNIKTTYMAHIVEYLAWAYQRTGKLEVALNYLDEILKNQPESNAKLTKRIILNIKPNITNDKESPTKLSYINTAYYSLCRGEKFNKSQPLNCKVDFNVHPYFAISPLRVEPILLDPPITLYHNLLNEKQISKLLQVTDNGMRRSQVSQGNVTVVKEIRVSQHVWVQSTHSNAKVLYNIVGAITGFDMTNSETIQLANYGIGGQYEPHFDFHGSDSNAAGLIGDRISTNMFYLSNVEEGGYTVFPKLDVYLKPVKGAMVMWYNLHKSLDGDKRTTHAGCPVLKGSKIIANIWTHSGKQEFRRPCDFKNDNQIR